MIDTAMLTRLMVLTGFAPPETPTPQATKEMLALARAIWTEAQNDEREACAKICDERKWRGEPLNFAEYCAEEIRMRSNEAVEKVFSSAHSAVNQTGYQES